jgi:putative tryptophan/tyrosine transport system substrate-binding protein
MRRREFITILGGSAVWPIAARGQHSGIPVIGFINGSSATAYAAKCASIHSWTCRNRSTVGENVAINTAGPKGHYDRIPDMVDDLVRRRVAVLAPNTPATHAAKRAAGNIPVVFLQGRIQSRAVS